MTVDSEIDDIQKQIRDLKETLSEARRRRPVEPVSDYMLTGSDGIPVSLSALFGDKDDLIVIHNMGCGCTYCTMWADGFNGDLHHLQDRAAFVVASPDDPSVQTEFAASRNWQFRMVSVAGSEFSKDLGFELNAGEFWPGFSAFQRQPDGTIVRTGRDFFGPGDDYCAPWPMFDLLAGGTGSWEPQSEIAAVRSMGS
jgi:predicted dithiol-disulfide oxidoreductase (DUF899 family)